MNIGIDATSWWNNRGFGRFTREILTALFKLDSPDHHFFLIVDQPLDELRPFSNVTVVQVATSRPTTEAAVADSNRSPFDMLRMYGAVARCPLDMMFFPAVYSWFPVPRKLPTMLAVLDAIAEHYPELIFPGWRSRLFWTIKMKLAIWSSERILTISNAAKEEIVEYIGADAGPIDVTSAARTRCSERTGDEAFIAAAARGPNTCPRCRRHYRLRRRAGAPQEPAWTARRLRAGARAGRLGTFTWRWWATSRARVFLELRKPVR